MRNSLGLDHNTFSHKDLGQSRITRDEKDVAAVVDLLDSSWINPFASVVGDPLVSLSTGKVAPDAVAEDLANARTIGEEAHQKFYAERVASVPPIKEFHSPLKKVAAKDFHLSARQEESLQSW